MLPKQETLIPIKPKYKALFKTNINILPHTKDDSSVFVIRSWLQKSESLQLLSILTKDLTFKSHPVVIAGRSIMQPRQIYVCGDSKTVKAHNYSGLSLSMNEWHPEVKRICDRIMSEYKFPANACLLNQYLDGAQSIGYHSDKEVNRYFNSAVYTVSLGASRRFLLKNTSTNQVVETILHDGDLCVMAGSTQEFWQHSIPKEKPKVKPLTMPTCVSV